MKIEHQVKTQPHYLPSTNLPWTLFLLFLQQIRDASKSVYKRICNTTLKIFCYCYIMWLTSQMVTSYSKNYSQDWVFFFMSGTKMSSLFAWSCLMFTTVLWGVIILILELRLNHMKCFAQSHLQYMLCLVAQSCPTLCEPVDASPPGSSVHGILQGRILEWVAIPFSRGSSQPRDWTQVSRIAGRFFTDWATREAPLSVSDCTVLLTTGRYFSCTDAWMNSLSLQDKS